MEHEGEFWRWIEGRVDQQRGHLRLVHDASESVVALVGEPRDEGTFIVEFLVEVDRDDPDVQAVLKDLRRELDMYLLEVGGPKQEESERWSGMVLLQPARG